MIPLQVVPDEWRHDGTVVRWRENCQARRRELLVYGTDWTYEPLDDGALHFAQARRQMMYGLISVNDARVLLGLPGGI